MTFSIAITAYFILSIAVVISLRIQLRNAIKLTHAYHLMCLESDRAHLDHIDYYCTPSEEQQINNTIAKLDKQIDKQQKHISLKDARKLTGDK